MNKSPPLKTVEYIFFQAHMKHLLKLLKSISQSKFQMTDILRFPLMKTKPSEKSITKQHKKIRNNVKLKHCSK